MKKILLVVAVVLAYRYRVAILRALNGPPPGDLPS